MRVQSLDCNASMIGASSDREPVGEGARDGVADDWTEVAGVGDGTKGVDEPGPGPSERPHPATAKRSTSETVLADLQADDESARTMQCISMVHRNLLPRS